MRSVFKKLKRKLHNSGSSIVLVIVALAFVGILTGSLLTAVAYAYRQKLYDYNARSNFYYLDQAMDELYAGVGSITMDSLTEAYENTREKAIYFDMDSESYKTKDNSDVNDIFKSEFMSLIADDTRFKVVKSDGHGGYVFSDGTTATEADYKASIVYTMENLISDSKVKLDSSEMRTKYVYADGSTDSYSYTSGTLTKIVLENVKLTRTVEYNRSNAKGEFSQSISTDMEISRPDFDVDFGTNVQDVSTLFDFCLVADSGVDFDRIGGDVLTVSGNVYAANDFYNKAYNDYSSAGKTESATDSASPARTYKMNKVSNYVYSADDPTNSTLYNRGQVTYRSRDKADFFYNGENDRSKYSGFYVDGGSVNILAERVIVPGSIAVMNGGSLSIYGLSKSNSLEETDIWTDEVVLGGYALPAPGNTNAGSSASFNANLYVLDDTQIESDYSKFKLNGSYFGYSNSAGTDGRVFLPTVTKSSTDTNIYQHKILNADGTTKTIENKGHYNSSAILVNGQNSVFDFTSTKSIFIAGRSYIELSDIKTNSVKTYSDRTKNINDTTDRSAISDANRVEHDDNVYQYDSVLDDYRTGESLSKKSSQLAYYPSKSAGGLDDTKTHYVLSSNTSGSTASNLVNMRLFTKYFGWDADITKRIVTEIPVIVQTATVGGKEKTYYYFDFEQAVLDHKYDTTFFVSDNVNSDRYVKDYSAYTNDQKIAAKNSGEVREYADVLQKNFIKDYYDYFNFCVNPNSAKKLDYMGYEEDYDDDSYESKDSLAYSDFEAKYGSSVDLTVLEPISNRVSDTETSTDISNARASINTKANELQNVTNYEDFVTGQIAVAEKIGTEDVNIYTSGAVTKSGNVFDKTFTTDDNKDIQFDVIIDNDSVISSTVNDTYKTDTDANTMSMASNYRDHYNVIKWTLEDQLESSVEYKFINDTTGASGGIGTLTDKEAYITPLNYYLNLDLLTDSTDVTPSDINLKEYKVWSSPGDVTITGNSEITGIIIAKGDVYFGSDVTSFNGLIISGGKVYITTSNTRLNTISATKVCKNIINECIAKASVYQSDMVEGVDTSANDEALAAIHFLKLFKAYEDIADAAESGAYNPEEELKITNVDYSDILRYNNWVRNVD